MKKSIALILAGMLLFICGCEDKKDTVKELSFSEETTESASDTAAVSSTTASTTSKKSEPQSSTAVVSSAPKEELKTEDIASRYAATVDKEFPQFPTAVLTDVTGMTYAEAYQALVKLGFEVERADAFSDSYEKGIVCDQNMYPGTTLLKGETVLITVSKGEGTKMLVPAVTGKTIDEAKNLISQSHLKIKTKLRCSNDVAEDTVISQNPKAGSELRADGYIEVTVSAGVGNTVGNTPSNAVNGGYVASHGSWIYYNNLNRNNYLYKMRQDGSQKQQVAPCMATNLNIVGDWIYFTEHTAYSSGLYKMRLDGTEEIRLSDDIFGWIYVVGNTIYYVDYAENGQLYKMDTNGENVSLLSNDYCINISVVDGWIFYLNIYDGKVYKIRTDGSDKKPINNDFSTYDLAYTGGKLFGSNGYNFISVSTGGSGLAQYNSECSPSFLNANGNWIYAVEFEPSAGKPHICRISADFKKKERLYSFKSYRSTTNFVNVIGEWIYFSNSDDSGLMYRIKTNGSSLQPIYGY